MQDAAPSQVDGYGGMKVDFYSYSYMTHSQMLGKVESGGGAIFKVVLEC